MATVENIAVGRRIEAIEASVRNLQLVWVRTTIVVYDRQVEPDYLTVGEVLDAAVNEPEPIELRRIPDLELLIDPITRTRKLRHRQDAAGQAEFDELKSRALLVDIEISCHEAQLDAILSKSLTTAAIGGNRAGKSMILLWWLFRRWMLRGGPGRIFWWISPSIEKRFAQGVYAIAGQLALGGGRWPDALMVLPKKGIPQSARSPRITMLDGSVIDFKHAAHDGGNLKSENVVDIVLDELGEIDDPDNFHQAKIRVSQTGGCVATATTRKRGHWMDDEITKLAQEAGPEVVRMAEFDLFHSPWMTFARIWQLFLNDRTLTRRQLEHEVLPATDKRAKCLELVKNPKSLREHFGIETAGERLMWSQWRDDFIYSSRHRRHDELHVHRDGAAVRLVNITAAVLARRLPNEAQSFAAWAGVDFNVRGHAVILEIFGEGSSPEAALANEASWTLLVSDEVQVDGTTTQLAEAIKQRAGVVPVFYDPHGAKGHAARGTGSSTDADAIKLVGLVPRPANGSTFKNGKTTVNHLSQIDSRNVMHGLMQGGRFYVHERCTGVLDAMHNDLAKPDGTIDKRSSPDSASDLRSGFSDSVRYGVWPVFKSLFKHFDQKSG